MDNNRQVTVFMICVLIINYVLSVDSDQDVGTPISIVSGVYWKEVDMAETYESSVPLVYKTTWPAMDTAHLSHPEGEGFCNGTTNNPDCVLFSWVAGVDKDIGARLGWLNNSLSEAVSNFNRFSGTRDRRSLHFLGDLAHWCCGVITSRQLRPLYADQQRMNLCEQQLSDELKEAYSEIGNLTVNINSYSSEVEQTFSQVLGVGVNITKVLDRLRSRVYVADQENHHRTYSLLQLNAMQEIRQLQILQLVTRLEILSQCREKKIPNSIIPLTKFKNDLLTLSASIKDDDYELVIPPEEVTKYLKLEIADCMISGITIIVHVKIPIRKLGARWKLYELISVPFAWDKSTCSVQHKTTFLAVDGERLMTIQGVATHDCRPYENHLCFVPRYAGDAVSGSLCPRAMFKGATIQELSRVCAFSCVPSQASIVTRVEEEIYILTHVSGTIELECRYGSNQTLEISGQGRPGALQVKVACDCKLVVNKQVLVFESYPCNKRLSVSEVIHLVPASWSKLRTLKIPAGNKYFSSVFDTLDECLDMSWPTVVPHWNLTYAASHHDIRPPLLMSGHIDSSLPIIFVLTHAVYFVLVTIIVVRNPHLVGLHTLNAASAKPFEIYVTEETCSEIVYVFVFIVVFVLCWVLIKHLYRFLRSGRVMESEESAMTVRRKPQDDGLPCGLPLMEVNGRELRVTLEWWDLNTSENEQA